MMMKTISDYTGYDYKTEFWTNNREYEHKVDLETIRLCIQNYSTSKDHFLDAGCGFGRLVPSYKDLFKNITLFDYANNLLNEAKEAYKQDTHISYQKGDLYTLNYNQEFDTVISIRTLHHITDTGTFFKNIHRALKKKGVFIFDVPNKIHLKNRFKHLLFKKPKDLYSLNQLIYMETYVNHHPLEINNSLKKVGLKLIEVRNSNMLRFNGLKKVLNTSDLVKLDLWLQSVTKKRYWSPSLYYITIKA